MAKKSGGCLKGCLIFAAIMIVLTVAGGIFAFRYGQQFFGEMVQQIDQTFQEEEKKLLKTPKDKIVKLDIVALVNDYYEDSENAKKKYEGKAISLTGEVGEHIELPIQLPLDYLTIRDKLTKSRYVLCLLSSNYKSKAETLKEGTPITILGKFGEFSTDIEYEHHENNGRKGKEVIILTTCTLP